MCLMANIYWLLLFSHWRHNKFNFNFSKINMIWLASHLSKVRTRRYIIGNEIWVDSQKVLLFTVQHWIVGSEKKERRRQKIKFPNVIDSIICMPIAYGNQLVQSNWHEKYFFFLILLLFLQTIIQSI